MSPRYTPRCDGQQYSYITMKPLSVAFTSAPHIFRGLSLPLAVCDSKCTLPSCRCSARRRLSSSTSAPGAPRRSAAVGAGSHGHSSPGNIRNAGWVKNGGRRANEASKLSQVNTRLVEVFSCSKRVFRAVMCRRCIFSSCFLSLRC